MKRRLRPSRALVVALVLALGLAACSGGKKKASSAPKDIPLRIGLVYTTTGQGGDLASAVLGAAKLASDDAKADQNVTITVTEADYGGDVTKIRAAVTSLQPKVDAIVVGTDDNTIVPSLGGVTVPMLHAFVTADDAIAGRNNVFRFAPSDQLEAQRLVAFMTEHRKYKRFAIIHDDTPFGLEGQHDIEAALSQKGLSLIGNYQFHPGGDVHTPVAAAGGKSIDAAIVWVTSAGEASRIVVDQHHSKMSYQLVLPGNLATATFSKNANAQVTPVAFRDGMLSVGPWAGPWFSLERIVRFYREFKTQNSALAPVQSAAIYDALTALAKVARQNGTSSDQIISGLESLKDFVGAGVPVTFGAGKHEGLDLDDLAVYGFTKEQTAPGGQYQPDVDTGGGFFSLVVESLDLPKQYAYLTNQS